MKEQSILDAFRMSRGHFRYESGHHGDLWLECDEWFGCEERVRDFSIALAEVIADLKPEVICGPEVGGARLASGVAQVLNVPTMNATREVLRDDSVEYRIDAIQREALRGRSVLIVDDVINAGSASLGTLSELQRAGANVVGVAALITLGDTVPLQLRPLGIPYRTISVIESNLWAADACPLCEAGVLIGRESR